jgi:hypothetical protein
MTESNGKGESVISWRDIVGPSIAEIVDSEGIRSLECPRGWDAKKLLVGDTPLCTGYNSRQVQVSTSCETCPYYFEC